MSQRSTAIRRLKPAFQKATVYQIFLRAFTPEGTLKAAERMLDHLNNLGVDILYLCPIVESDDDMDRNGWSPRQKASGLNNPKNPYRIKDYYKIDPEYGSDADLRSFVKQAHHYGMKVILDLVYLHCGPSATFIATHPNFVQRKEDQAIVTNEYNFPLINFRDDELREYLWKNMEYFIREFDVDGYRCDVAFEVPLDFWEAARPRMEALKPGIFMLSESLGNEAEQVRAFDVSYGVRFPHEIHDVLEKKMNAADLKDFINQLDAKIQSARVLRAIDNHDLANDFKEKRADAGYPFEAVNCMLVLCFSLEGIPFLYNGQEIADANLHSLWANREHGHNNIVDWSNALTAKGKQRLSLMQSLIALRKQEPALYSGKRTWVSNDRPEAVFSFTRTTKSETILAVFNFSESTVHTTVQTAIDTGDCRTIIESDSHSESLKNEIQIDLPPFGYAMLKASV